jgi:hypothetical protein
VRAVTFEVLEGRRLLASFTPFAVNINFQRLIDPTVPPNYRADIGSAYGRRTNGLTYGWSSDVSASALNRNDVRSPDERYDTFNYLGADQTWQIAVPAGAYRVRVVAGDPKVFNSTFRISAEDAIVTEGTATTRRRWFDGTTTVAVTDGALTLASAPGSINNKLCFVEIVRVQPPPAPPAAPGRPNARTVSTVTNAITWQDFSADEAGFRVERARGTSGSFMPVGVVGRDVTRFVDTQLAPGTKYTYRVRAFNAAGASAASATDAARTFNVTGSSIVWEQIAPAPVERAEALTATIGGKLYIFGGFSGSAGPIVRSDVYDPVANAWSRLPDLPTRLTHAGVAVDGHDVYFAGGYIGTGPGYQQQFGTSDVWRFNVDINEFTRLPNLPAPLAGGGFVALGRELHYFGGNDASRNDVDVHYVLNLDNPTTWTTAAALPAGRSHLGYSVVGGKIYAIGGQFGNDGSLTTSKLVHVWDPALPGAWTARASMPSAVSHVASSTFVLGSRIIVAGGETDHEQPTAAVVTYDTLTNTWSTLTPLPAPRFSGAARAIEGVLYFSGGSSLTTTYRGMFAG